ncbi:multidrug effflux MFS transporter [Candidatus Finniella inopinata]|uniref:Bcr/CflA family efflux transporter n=1 Tax=Candidatus Finniella inopinata TaxID=1696036 RepID=A0A4V2DZW5_9PROT|nr:multidrug effflux MFS transporter [Candidatus Finniella inopinata]RZI46477.1 Bcr/CflA family efflux MFS transporter [Candidatus Finniella inopinata]
MKINSLPALWLLVLIVGLPQLTETVYTPSLPTIAHALHVAEFGVEYTLTIYLFAFALGTLFWGKVSDVYGRKPCLLIGLVIYGIGCVGCYCSDSIAVLMASRFVQAFGGSVGSVLGQAICRDAFQGAALGKAYSTIGSGLALFPAIGPVIGGIIDQMFGWSTIFLALIGAGSFVAICSFISLPETHFPKGKPLHSFFQVGSKLLRDTKVLGFGLIVAGCNGITFSYYAEGPFFLIEILGLTPAIYGTTYLAISGAMVIGGLISRHLHQQHSNTKILSYGLKAIFLGSALLAAFILLLQVLPMPNNLVIITTIGCMMIVAAGVCISSSNALAMALKDYSHAIGTASSVFGFFYYLLISLFTLGMGWLHNSTLLPMPLYFLGIALFMMVSFKALVEEKV